MKDSTHRGDFDAAVQARFPKARRIRKELANGWEDTFRIWCLEVSVRSYTHKTPQRAIGKVRTPDVGTVVAEIRAVRVGVDGSVTTMWRLEEKGWGGLERLLDELRQELLGLSAGISVVAGRGARRRLRVVLPDEDFSLLDRMLDTGFR